jgi:hypothetical protein
MRAGVHPMTFAVPAFWAVLLLSVPTVAPGAEKAKFARPPAVTRKNGGAIVSFAVAAPTDAEVAVLDAGGKVVRHLGGAALGAEKPPPPPFRPGLSQEISWDGRDDAGRQILSPSKGKPAAGGPFKARVRLGLKAEFDRFIGWRDVPPLDQMRVVGLAVGPDRSVYVLSSHGLAPAQSRTENRLWVMSGDGKYLRTLYPYPAAADPKKLRGVDFLSEEPGRLEPRVYDRVCPSFLPQMRALPRQTMTVASDGRLVFSNGWSTELYKFGPRCLLVMNADGSIPRERLDGPVIDEEIAAGYLHVALSPDEKNAYFCGLHEGSSAKKPCHVVYRVGLGVKDTPQVIFGQSGKALSGRAGLNDPRGLASDDKGRLYVSDFGNDRVVVLDPAGKYLGEIPVKGPETIVAHPKTGAVYVLSMFGKREYKLVKFAGFKNPKAGAELELTSFGSVTNPKTHPNYHPVMALDPHGDRPLVYLGSPAGFRRAWLLRVEDAGAELKLGQVDLRAEGAIQGSPYPQGVDAGGDFHFLALTSVNPANKHCGGWKVDAKTGELKPWDCGRGYRYAFGRDGMTYRAKAHQGEALFRLDPGGKPAPFKATGEKSEPYPDRWRFLRNNAQVLADGSIWTLHFPSRGGGDALVSVIGLDGKMRRKGVVKGLQAPVGLRLDSRGNIYVADGLHLDGKPYPPEIAEFVGRLRAAGTTPRGRHSEAPEDCYGEGYGSILKFGPEGGEIALGAAAGDGGKQLASYPGKFKFAASGLKAAYGRISPMSPPRARAFSACWCLHAIFDIDAHDRLFVPDAMQFKVRVLDASFNQILAFGEYDGATGKGGKANAPGPAIPFEYPTYVSAAGDVAYVTDTVSCARRIVRVRLKYAAEETCGIR